MMENEMTEASGKVKYSDGKELKFVSLLELIGVIKNNSSALPEFVYVYGVDSEKKVSQLVLDFNSFSQQNIDIETIKVRRFQKYLGDILIDKNFITRDKLNAALKVRDSSSYNERLGEVLVRLGYITSDKIIEALNEQLGLKI